MIDIMIKPKCKCHDIEMGWNSRNGKGSWYCRIKKSERDKRYRETANGFFVRYVVTRKCALKKAHSKTSAELKNVRKQIKELGLEPRQK